MSSALVSHCWCYGCHELAVQEPVGYPARRRLARGGMSIGLRPVQLGDDRHARRPLCEAVQAAGGNFNLICKPPSYKILSQQFSLWDLLPPHNHDPANLLLVHVESLAVAVA